ncbi:MAG: hypothetical protein IT580_20825 [Verrucomicrobiales bacterium]|nr:hypothetical protein [Verrucomicrobiales bacterium]
MSEFSQVARTKPPGVPRWARGLVAAGVLLAVLGFWERGSGRTKLALERERLRTAGERTVLRELLPAPVADASNAWTAMLPWTNQLHSLTGALTRASMWIWAQPGILQRIPVSRAEEGGAPEVAEVRAFLAAQPALVRGVQDAVLRPEYEPGMRYTNGFFDLPADAVVGRRGGQLLMAVVAEALARGAADEAAQGLEALLSLAAHLDRQPLLISGMVGCSLTQLAVPLTAQVLAVEGVPDAVLERLQRRWSQLQPAAALERHLEFERALSLDHYRLLVESAERRRKAGEWPAEAAEIFGVPEPSVWVREARRWVQEPLWGVLWADHEVAWSLRRWADRLHVTRTGRHEGWSTAWHDIAGLDVKAGSIEDVEWPGVQPPSRWDRVRCRFALGGPVLIPESTWFRSAVRAEVAARLGEAAVAVRRYTLRHRNPPTSTAALVPEFLPEPLLDPMDRRPLRLHSRGVGRVPYSVGHDGTDEQGSCAVEGDHPYRTPMDGRDWVFPAVTD